MLNWWQSKYCSSAAIRRVDDFNICIMIAISHFYFAMHLFHPGADPGFWERGGLINIFTAGEGTGGGVPPPVTARGFWGSADSSPSGVWGEAPATFLLLRLFNMKFTVISINTYTSRDIRITRACMDSDEKTVHSSQCYGSYCSAINFVTQSFCEFVTEACTWPSTSYMSVYKRLMYVFL